MSVPEFGPILVNYVPVEESESGKRHRGPREERENPLIVGSQEFDPAPYIQILREIDNTLGTQESLRITEQT